jgi:release factor glutamine methyltransferase
MLNTNQSNKNITISVMLSEMTRQLISVSKTPRLDAELLMSKTLMVERNYFYAHPEEKLTAKDLKSLRIFLERRLKGEPIAYILGWKEFWSLKLQVTPDVLIPRPETELLVELILQNFPKDLSFNLVDLGTGSGAIALALASERPMWRIAAVDLSVAALNVARLNAECLGLREINFICSDWCSALSENSFDIIVANPPYVAAADLSLLRPEMQFEPREALLAGVDGLAALRIIISQAKSKLQKGGWLFLEHGFDQSAAVINLFRGNNYGNIFQHTDLAGLDRATYGQVG